MRRYPATRYRRLAALLLLLLSAAGLVAYLLKMGGAPKAPDAGPDLALFSADPADFARATGPREFSFPRDHGPHPQFRNEWWYFTGNLSTPAGRPFGFELTFFRNALTRHPIEGESRWSTNQVYMAHFALSDIEAGQFHAFERYSRGALELAGAQHAPFRVWLHHWQARGDDPFPMRLQAADSGVELRLTIEADKPPVLQGDEGYSQKSAEAGNASYYYSFTRLAARGEVTIDGESWPVQGLAWLDREWSTSALAKDQQGWDWFALQLSDGTDLMYYHLRRKNGSRDPHSAGVVVEENGGYQTLPAEAIEIEVLDFWRSPASGARYPSGWRLRGEELDLTVTPRMRDQELDLSFRYWEGAVEVSGEHRGAEVSGHGYVELTGY